MEHARIVSLGMLLVFLLGCGPSGPPLGIVEGTVTLDGQPVEGAFVTFHPLFEGGMEIQSAQKTGADGHFEMQYSIERKGVPIGEHQVSISTLDYEKQPDGSNKRIPEKVPAYYYGSESILTFTVKEGRNTADFQLSKKKPK